MRVNSNVKYVAARVDFETSTKIYSVHNNAWKFFYTAILRIGNFSI